MIEPRRTTSLLIYTLWAPAAVLALHWVVYGLSIYERIAEVDAVIHLLGGAAVAHALGLAIAFGRQRGALELAPIQLESLALVTGTAVIAVGWECFEFILDRLIGTRLLGDLADTLSDLLFGLLGAAIYSVFHWRQGRNRTSS